MKKSELEAHAQFCIANKLPLSILVTEPGLAFPVQITHPFENIPTQMEYYKYRYDDDCKRKDIEGYEIIAIVDPAEPTLATGEATLLPYASSLRTSPLRKNHIRVEDSYGIESREKQIFIEGRVEDVMKIMKYIKAGEIND